MSLHDKARLTCYTLVHNANIHFYQHTYLHQSLIRKVWDKLMAWTVTQWTSTSGLSFCAVQNRYAVEVEWCLSQHYLSLR
jgi:hypothetical protein